MKRLCAYFLAAALLLGLVVPGQPAKAADLKTAEALNLTPTMDGDISEWANDTQYELSQRVVDGEAATTGWFKIRWDGSAIYIAGQITDATKEDYNDQIKFLFSFDGVPVGETALDFSYVPKGGVYTWTAIGTNANGGNSLNMVNWNPENAYNNLQNAGAAIMGDGVNYSLFYNTYSDGVYTFESSWYPTDELKAFLTAGRQIGFDLRWNDFNNGTSSSDSKLTTIGWASDATDWNSDLRKIGQVTLKGFDVPAAVANKVTPTVDGDISEWAEDAQYTLSQRVVDGEAATTGWYKIRWDDSAIYVAGQITDATKEDYNDQIKFLFSFDGVSKAGSAVNFGSLANAGVYSWNPACYHPLGGNSLNMVNWNPENAYGNAQNAGAAIMGDGVNYSLFSITYADGVYTFESSWYPTDELKACLTAGRELGFDLRWNDFNGAASQFDTKMTTIGWASDEADWNSDLRKIGKVTLTEVVEVPEIETKEAIAYKGTPAVDGDISEWAEDTQYALERRVVDGEAATTGWYKIRWDDSAIYVAGQITDATKEDYNDQIKFLFSFDGVPAGETALDFSYVPKAGVYSWTSVGYNPNGNSLNMGNWNPENAYGNAQNAGAAIMGDGVNYSMFSASYNDGVYTFESSWYPTDELKAYLTEGRKLGFDLRWNDFNGATSQSDTKMTTIGWASAEIDWNSDLRKIGQVTLSAPLPIQPALKGWNIALGDNIAVKYYVQLDPADVPNTQVKITVAGQTTVYEAANAPQNDDGLYVFTAEMAAAQMMDSIHMVLVIDGQTMHADDYSIYAYADYILKSEAYDEATKKLVSEMLNYGAAAQNYFGYNKDNLPAVPEGVGAQSVPAAEQTPMAVNGSVTGIGLYGTTLLFRNKTAVRFYFVVSGQISDYEITYNGVEQTAVAKDGFWYVEIANINPQDMGQTITVTVTCGGETMTVTYGPMNYMVRMSQKGSDSLKALLKAMYNYHLAAKEYPAT